MLAKYFKEIINKVDDNKIILFDDGSGILQPIKSVLTVDVTTEDSPGDPDPEFVSIDDYFQDFSSPEELREWIEAFGKPTILNVVVFSVSEAEEEENNCGS